MNVPRGIEKIQVKRSKPQSPSSLSATVSPTDMICERLGLSIQEHSKTIEDFCSMLSNLNHDEMVLAIRDIVKDAQIIRMKNMEKQLTTTSTSSARDKYDE